MNTPSIERLKDFEHDPLNNFLSRSEMMEVVKELIAIRELKVDQVPVEYQIREINASGTKWSPWRKVSEGYYKKMKPRYEVMNPGVECIQYRELFTAPQKPVVPVGFLFVVKATGAVIYSIADAAIEGTQLIDQIYGDTSFETTRNKPV